MSSSRLKAAAPSVVTSGNLVVGLVSIALSAMGHFEGAAWAIVYCGILDKADGTLARALKVQSSFGMEMDSFADYTSFGLAPAALTWFLCTAAGIPAFPLWVWIGGAAALVPVAAAIRLARFNSVSHEDPTYFSGVPTTMVAGMFATLYLSLVDLKIPMDPVWIMPSAAIAGAALMVCGLRVPKIKGSAQRWKNVLLVGILLALTILAVAQVLPEVMFGLGFFYVVIGSLRSRRTDGQGPGVGVSSRPGGEA
jgi:CDP-diacylglycerol--serine O-phosphatidyltransferase